MKVVIIEDTRAEKAGVTLQYDASSPDDREEAHEILRSFFDCYSSEVDDAGEDDA